MLGIDLSTSVISLIAHFFIRRDNVQWDEEQENKAKSSVAGNSEITLTDEQLQKYEDDADQYWNAFYNIHQNR